MIVKMKFINISGPRNDIDRVTDTYLSKYEIQLESALSELKTVDNLRPFVELNPYRDALSMANKFVGYLDNPDKIKPDATLALDDMFELVRTANEEYEHLQEKKEKQKQAIGAAQQKQQIISPFQPLDCNLQEVLNYRFIAYRFGKLPIEYYHKMQKYLADDLDAIYVEGDRDDTYVYGAYFVSPGEAPKADAIFRSLHFERITLTDEYINKLPISLQNRDLSWLLHKNVCKSFLITLMFVRWQPAWKKTKKIITFYADGWQKMMSKNLQKKLKMMTKSLLL